MQIGSPGWNEMRRRGRVNCQFMVNVAAGPLGFDDALQGIDAILRRVRGPASQKLDTGRCLEQERDVPGENPVSEVTHCRVRRIAGTVRDGEISDVPFLFASRGPLQVREWSGSREEQAP